MQMYKRAHLARGVFRIAIPPLTTQIFTQKKKLVSTRKGNHINASQSIVYTVEERPESHIILEENQRPSLKYVTETEV